jgi:hypothetical protein
MNLQSPKERELSESIKFLEAERDEVRRKKTIKCEHCEKRTQIGKATIISENSYVRPYSCSGGDYWQFREYLFVCLKCCKTNRAYVGTWDRIKWSDGDKLSNISPESLKDPRVKLYFIINEYKRYFGEHLQSYDDLSGSLDDLRKKNEERKERRELY